MDEHRTIADPTLLVREDALASAGRAVLLVYSDIDGARQSRLIELHEGSPVVVGRSRSCTVHVDSDAVSRKHASIARQGRTITVEDLGSRNGTKVNGESIKEQVVLSSGDEIRVGPITAILSIRTRAQRRASFPGTGDLRDRLTVECDRCRRYHRPLALLMMQMNGPDEAVDLAMDRLSQRVRAMDLVCEYAPNVLAIVLPELSAGDVEELTRHWRQLLSAQLGSAPDALRMGMALYPGNGSTPDDLVGSARRALAGAGNLGASPPTSAGAARPADTVIVDPQMRRVYELADRVADSNMTVLIHGETGAGKELVASALHRGSKRSGKAYLRLNCASLPENLLESELFGHEKGAFTGADKKKEGYFEAARGGTLFLDEIGEISANVQAKLLRVLENKHITRVGGTSEIPVDVRIVCATNRDLETEVREGRFREDLFYRIGAFTIVVPALRDRPADILPLCEHFLRHYAQGQGVPCPSLAPDAQALLSAYDWPGNVRQLRNAMERAVVLATGGVVTGADLPDRVREQESEAAAPVAPATGKVDVKNQLADVERQSIVAALESSGGNQTHAAKALGLSRRALIYKMEKYGLKEPPASRKKG